MKNEQLYHITFGWGTVLEVTDDNKITVEFEDNDKIFTLSLTEVLSVPTPKIFFENHEIYKEHFCNINKIANSRYFGEFLWKETIQKAKSEKRRLERLKKLPPPIILKKRTPAAKKTTNNISTILPSSVPAITTTVPPPTTAQCPISTSTPTRTVSTPSITSPPSKTLSSLLPMQQSQNTYVPLSPQEKLLDIWRSLGFEGFLHTTEFENFKKIIADGKLICRERLISSQHTFSDKANQEIIDRTDHFTKTHCRFYYRFKTPTNYAARYQRPVILVFTGNMLHWNNIKISYGNAASNYHELVENADEALAFNWDIVFENRPPYESKLVDFQESTRIQNSEFLVKNSVAIRFIEKIYFKYKSDMEIAHSFCSPELIQKFCLDRSKFV